MLFSVPTRTSSQLPFQDLEFKLTGLGGIALRVQRPRKVPSQSIVEYVTFSLFPLDMQNIPRITYASRFANAPLRQVQGHEPTAHHVELSPRMWVLSQQCGRYPELRTSPNRPESPPNAKTDEPRPQAGSDKPPADCTDH